MKLALILLALLASSIAVEIDENFEKSELAKDLQEFVNLMPFDEIVEITVDYLSEDKQFEEVLLYLKSEKFKLFVIDIESLPEVQLFMNYLQKKGVHIYELVNKLNDLLNIDHIKPSQYVAKITGGGVKGYLKDVLAIIPYSQLQNLYFKKLMTSKAFINFVAWLESDNFKEIVNFVYNHNEFQYILKKLKEADVDYSTIKKVFRVFLGIKFPEKPYFLR